VCPVCAVRVRSGAAAVRTSPRRRTENARASLEKTHDLMGSTTIYYSKRLKLHLVFYLLFVTCFLARRRTLTQPAPATVVRLVFFFVLSPPPLPATLSRVLYLPSVRVGVRLYACKRLLSFSFLFFLIYMLFLSFLFLYFFAAACVFVPLFAVRVRLLCFTGTCMFFDLTYSLFLFGFCCHQKTCLCLLYFFICFIRHCSFNRLLFLLPAKVLRQSSGASGSRPRTVAPSSFRSPFTRVFFPGLRARFQSAGEDSCGLQQPRYGLAQRTQDTQDGENCSI